MGRRGVTEGLGKVGENTEKYDR